MTNTVEQIGELTDKELSELLHKLIDRRNNGLVNAQVRQDIDAIRSEQARRVSISLGL